MYVLYSYRFFLSILYASGRQLKPPYFLCVNGIRTYVWVLQRNISWQKTRNKTIFIYSTSFNRIANLISTSHFRPSHFALQHENNLSLYSQSHNPNKEITVHNTKWYSAKTLSKIFYNWKPWRILSPTCLPSQMQTLFLPPNTTLQSLFQGKLSSCFHLSSNKWKDYNGISSMAFTIWMQMQISLKSFFNFSWSEVCLRRF